MQCIFCNQEMNYEYKFHKPNYGYSYEEFSYETFECLYEYCKKYEVGYKNNKLSVERIIYNDKITALYIYHYNKEIIVNRIINNENVSLLGHDDKSKNSLYLKYKKRILKKDICVYDEMLKTIEKQIILR